MKKLFLIMVMAASVVTVSAQSQLTTISGKTKDQKTIEVKYYKGAVGDYVESVKYQVVDELQAQVKRLQEEMRVTQRNLDVANNTIRELRNNSANAANSEELTRLRKQIAENEAHIEELEDSIAVLQAQLGKTSQQYGAEVQSLQNEIAMQNQTIQKQNRQIEDYKKGINTPVVGLEAGWGLVFSTQIEDGWKMNLSNCLQVDAYFGTSRLSESLPISLEAGLGLRRISMSAYLNSFELTNSTLDVDNDSCQVTYTFANLSEHLSLTYLDIPIRLCFGLPFRNKASVYAKIGITPSINTSSSFEGSGMYNRKGFYPQWGVTLENIEELDYVEGNCYPEEVNNKINVFNLWGNVSLGGYVPLSENIPLVLNIGLKLDFPILSIGTINADENDVHVPNNHTGLLQSGGKIVIPSAQIGLIYTLK